jgi:hypothetical protein
MKEPIYQLIVESVMKRLPDGNEEPEDFFIGVDGFDNSYLLLPTPERLFGKNDMFAIRFIRQPFNKFRYELDTHFTKVSFNEMESFYDDKTFFFGPDDNMLKQFLQGETYQTYVEWVDNLYTKRLYDLAKVYLKANGAEKQQIS